MADNGLHHHRSSLKQSNKPFKSRHASKSHLKKQNKGRVERSNITNTGRNAHKASKADRKNKAKMDQLKKRETVVKSNRLFGGKNGAAKVVAIVPLCPDSNPLAIVENLFTASGQTFTGKNKDGSITLLLPKYKQKLLLLPLQRHLFDILDAAKIADFVIFALSAVEEVDTFGTTILSSLKSQGCPTVIPTVQNLSTALAQSQQKPGSHAYKKVQTDIIKSLTTYMSHHFPESCGKVFDMELDRDGGEDIDMGVGSTPNSTPTAYDIMNNSGPATLLRHLSQQHPRQLRWRDRHAYITPSNLSFTPSESTTTEGTLRVTGWVRGNNLDINRVLHITGWGDFQISQIESASTNGFEFPQIDMDGNILPSKRSKPDLMDDEPIVISKPDMNIRESLVTENEVDPMMGEQTWPTEEELADAEARVRAQGLKFEGEEEFGKGERKKSKRVPKGTSEYQAAWISDEDDDDDDDEYDSFDDDEEDHEMNMALEEMDDEHLGDASMKTNTQNAEDDEEYETISVNSRMSQMDELSPEEEHQQYLSYLKEQQQASQENLLFPDEIDTPLNINARDRFQKYRGLKSFRTSPWDPYENLPVDYSRIFAFENFPRTRKRVFKNLFNTVESSIAPGAFVTLVVDHVPTELFQTYETDSMKSGEYVKPLVAFMLLEHEVKKSVVNMVMTRTGDENDAAIKSKEHLIVQTGFRRYLTQPVYSCNTRGGTNNVHKYERFFQPASTVIATAFLPIQYAPSPVLFFHPSINSSPESINPLIATGSILSIDPNRVLAKRIIITGHPFKIHKRTAVIRYMFFNVDDIMYFKPVELTTKYGRKGHITESLGTHGYMKCMFDGPLKQQDTVCMYLYKRVFPKWTTEVYREGMAIPLPKAATASKPAYASEIMGISGGKIVRFEDEEMEL